MLFAKLTLPPSISEYPSFFWGGGGRRAEGRRMERERARACKGQLFRTAPGSVSRESNHAFIIDSNKMIPDPNPSVQSNSTSPQNWLDNTTTAILVSLQSKTWQKKKGRITKEKVDEKLTFGNKVPCRSNQTCNRIYKRDCSHAGNIEGKSVWVEHCHHNRAVSDVVTRHCIGFVSERSVIGS